MDYKCSFAVLFCLFCSFFTHRRHRRRCCYSDVGRVFRRGFTLELVIDDRLGFVSRDNIATMRERVAPLLRDKSVYSITYCRRGHLTDERENLAAAVCDAFWQGSGLETQFLVAYDYRRIYGGHKYGTAMSALYLTLERKYGTYNGEKKGERERHRCLPPILLLDCRSDFPATDASLSFDADMKQVQAEFAHKMALLLNQPQQGRETQRDFLFRRYTMMRETAFEHLSTLSDKELDEMQQEATRRAERNRFPLSLCVEDGSFTMHYLKITGAEAAASADEDEFFLAITIAGLTDYFGFDGTDEQAKKNTFQFAESFVDRRRPNVWIDGNCLIILDAK